MERKRDKDEAKLKEDEDAKREMDEISVEEDNNQSN